MKFAIAVVILSMLILSAFVLDTKKHIPSAPNYQEALRLQNAAHQPQLAQSDQTQAAESPVPQVVQTPDLPVVQADIAQADQEDKPQSVQTEEPQVIRALVVSATPSFRDVDDRHQECRIVEVPVNYEEQVFVNQAVPNVDSSHPMAGALLGALAGGVVGNQIGNGGGRELARAAGVFTGLVVGNQLGSQPPTRIVQVMHTVQRTRYEQQQRCEEVFSIRREIIDYTVVYSHEGQTMTTTMPNDPGKFITLAASR